MSGRTFTDNAGRTWLIAVTITGLKRIKAMLGLDLVNDLDEVLVQKLLEDPLTLVDVLFVLCKPQADELDVSDEAFGVALGGNDEHKPLDQAADALIEGLVDFFRQYGRAPLAAALQKSKQATDRLQGILESRLDEFDPAIDAALEKANDEISRTLAMLGNGSTNSRASSGANPDP